MIWRKKFENNVKYFVDDNELNMYWLLLVSVLDCFLYSFIFLNSYNKVIDFCVLKFDIVLFFVGDEIEVGEKVRSFL